MSKLYRRRGGRMLRFSPLWILLHRPPRSLLGSPANTQLPDWAQETLITVSRLSSLNTIPAPDLCVFSLCH
ncbi:hypothetical protein FD755_011891 [Muntiacus reevesi]|uniref:Uncharacterized protein n=1 Tax=Muntiacus reevesi TaxID=9886 RepID=A0A5N3XTX4_MUNRE|nr:hypothetical protein FD755_011891 [Muntiacus reevesi]